MDVNEVLDRIRSHPRIQEAGMVLIHLGQVRSSDLKGRPVRKLYLEHDRGRAEAIRAEMLNRPGIVEIVIQLGEGWLELGQPIMIAAVAGRTRGEVFPVLEEMVDRLKGEAVSKKEELG